MTRRIRWAGAKEYQKKFLRNRRSKGLCYACKEQAAPNRSLCEHHSELRKSQARRRYHENPNAAREKARVHYHSRMRNNPEKLRARARIYRKKNRARIRGYRNPKYWLNEKHRARARQDWHRRKSDPQFRLKSALRRRIYMALRNNFKSGRTIELLGCSIPDFRIYLESLFEPGMTWENYGRGATQWSIDHIVPCAIFDLSKADHQKRCFHFSNMQPMWHKENLQKQAKTDGQMRIL